MEYLAEIEEATPPANELVGAVDEDGMPATASDLAGVDFNANDTAGNITADNDANDPTGGDTTNNNDKAGSKSNEVDAIDVINQSLESLLAKAQEQCDAAAEAVAKKHEELKAAEAEAEAKIEEMNALKEHAQALSEDEAWQSMYHKLIAWSKEHGHCNPRRNWKSKIDAEEKALGNWSGKQRRDERQGKLNPLKKTALEKICFAFEVRGQKWDEFKERLKAYIAKHDGKIANINSDEAKEAGVSRQLYYWLKQPKQILGEYKDPRAGIKREMKNEKFTQERIDFLTECGMEWQLSKEQVDKLKEKGLNFPQPYDELQPEKGDIIALEKHSWLQMFEALVEFKQQNGHTYVSKHNSSEELYHWVSEQRKKREQFVKRPNKDKLFAEYQAEMLSSIDFVYAKGDTEWMENYERLRAFKRLFGTVAVTDKFVSFEAIAQWVDDNKRLHLGLPLLEGMTWVRSSNTVSIPLEEREALLKNIGAFDIPLGEEEVEARKSNYFFRTSEQVRSWDTGVLKSIREKRKASMRNPSNNPEQRKEPPETLNAPPTQSLHEKCLDKALSDTPREPHITVDAQPHITVDAQKEKDFFLKRGAVVSVSIEERNNIPQEGIHRYYPDGRPAPLCRISNCYTKQGGAKKQHLCTRHFNLIESALRTDILKPPATEANEDKTGESPNGGENADEWETRYACSYCNEQFGTYDEAADHEKGCESHTVEEATPIELPAPANKPTKPSWTKVPMPHNLKGEAKVLAEDYRSKVWQLASGYRKKASESPKQTGKTEYISAALGEKSRQPHTIAEDDYHSPTIKFPTRQDELEAIRLFRRCGGPLAATVSGRKKLDRESKLYYGDGRPLRFCRVSGCQMVHDDGDAGVRRYLCDWHYCMIVKQSTNQSQAEKRKRNTEEAKLSKLRANTRAKNETVKSSNANAKARKKSPSSRHGPTLAQTSSPPHGGTMLAKRMPPPPVFAPMPNTFPSSAALAEVDRKLNATYSSRTKHPTLVEQRSGRNSSRVPVAASANTVTTAPWPNAYSYIPSAQYASAYSYTIPPAYFPVASVARRSAATVPQTNAHNSNTVNVITRQILTIKPWQLKRH